MSAVTTGSDNDGDESVKADDGLDEATSIIAAPMMAAITPPLRRANIKLPPAFLGPSMTVRPGG